MIQINNAALLPIFIVISALIVFKHKKAGIDRRKLILDVLFSSYTIVVINMLYFPLVINYSEPLTSTLHYNLEPLSGLFYAIESSTVLVIAVVLGNLIANLMLFVPLSAYMIIRFDIHFAWKLLIVIVVSTSAELIQLGIMTIARYYNRIFDIDDLICNFLGAVISLLFFNQLVSRSKSKALHDTTA